MKTIHTREESGFIIVTGISVPPIDPVETRWAVAGMLEKTIEATKVIEINHSIVARLKMARESADKEDRKMHLVVVDNIRKDAAPLIAALEKKRVDLMMEHAVYFEPRKDGFSIEDQAANDLMAKRAGLKKNELLAFDGSIVQNFKACKYWKKTSGVWAENQIFNIGESLPTGAVLDSDLTGVQKSEIAAQVETERFAALSAPDKLSEFDSLKSGISAESTALKNQLEFDADPDAVAKAQASYDSKLAELKLKYGY